MSILSANKYKEKKPTDTVKIIKKILDNIGIELDEEIHLNSAEGFHSIHLRVKGANALNVNGKGTTYEYALASAYGEFMERLQNKALYNYKVDLCNESKTYLGFYNATDEKYLNIEEFVLSDENWIRKLFPQSNSKEDIINSLKELMFLTPDGYSCDLICIPFYNINSNKLSYVPTNIIEFCYCTNGMSAGNTLEEGLVQGLSEIIERYINKKIHREKIVPPTIPMDYLKKFPLPYKMIQEIEEIENYEVIIKDCSLGGKYPVVGLIIIDKNTQKYFCKFGCHPVFEIALERTLTELLQGKQLDNLFDMVNFSYINSKINSNENYESIFTNGAGFYPTEYFSDEFTYSFIDIKDNSKLDNKEMLEYLIKIITDQGFDVLVRDVSYLNFPSVNIIVPGMSEINELTKENINEVKISSNIRNELMNLNNIKDNDIEEIISYMKKKYFTNDDTVFNLLKIPLNDSFSYNNLRTDLFVACLYYKAKRYRESYYELNKYIKYIKKFKNIDTSALAYYKCCRDYIGGKAEQHDEKSVKSILIKFYPVDIVEKVIKDLKNPNEIFKYHDILNCYDCEECNLKSNCSYNIVKRIHKTLKEQQKIVNLNQLKIFDELFK
ncbi:hypothetical protein SH1V18_01190 [Vallitalea longa]|uniref:YcaO domain-containing protein n=1 Tax=Vallitalea longa TaxID=2936439 RepID=A0A9W5Y940_9FIRM|nr:YcaO-like family protein [Vallitalea longa]GKX27639.1 hypothetical protein SH1V18_01190 [Vallitalea longa]